MRPSATGRAWFRSQLRNGTATRRLGVLAVPLTLAALAVTGLSGALAANDGKTAESGNGNRFTMMRDGDDIIRMDNETGQMSVCKRRGEQLVCQMAADDRAVIEEEFETLLGRIDRLEKDRVARNSDDEDWDHDPDFKQFDKDLDTLLRYSTRAIKRFRGTIQELNRDTYD
ncbi:MAG: hypothetical protein KDJ80_13590 [Nitratireductor sp.]|nr:hypothetical protein [Nitratireductor sp.]